LYSLPNPNQETVSLRKVEGGIAAVIKFSGKPTEDSVREKEKILRSNIIKDGLKPQPGCLLARYNDPGRTWSFIMVCYKTLIAVNLFLICIGVLSTSSITKSECFLP
jgi:hypothetical protein